MQPCNGLAVRYFVLTGCAIPLCRRLLQQRKPKSFRQHSDATEGELENPKNYTLPFTFSNL